jgi:hypothetical protein
VLFRRTSQRPRSEGFAEKAILPNEANSVASDLISMVWRARKQGHRRVFVSSVIIPAFLLVFRRTTTSLFSSQTARGNRTYRRAYLAISNADGPEAEARPVTLLVASPIAGIRPRRLIFAGHRLDGPTHSNTPRYCNRPFWYLPQGMPETELWIRIQSLPWTKPPGVLTKRRRSISTLSPDKRPERLRTGSVLRRSSRKKLSGKAWVRSPFPI